MDLKRLLGWDYCDYIHSYSILMHLSSSTLDVNLHPGDSRSSIYFIIRYPGFPSFLNVKSSVKIVVV